MENVIENWLNLSIMLGWFFLGYSALILIGYHYQLQTLKRRTEQYKFASEKEIKFYEKAARMLGFAVGFIALGLIGKALGTSIETYEYFFVVFISAIIGMAVGYAIKVYLDYYYPFTLEKRLNKIRFKPRHSVSGREMKLLNENEEDIHLTAEMIEEENEFSADYDVWIDELTGEKIIEKYDTHFHTLICEECNFRTLVEKDEEVVQAPTAQNEGVLKKHYSCSYCGHHQTIEAKLPNLERSKELKQELKEEQSV
ncbi:hypothetical protein [Marinoscillum sp.]|uniref:hypothetical protein n=1 Tax=Marinoscillum sp. TaxID=2024838 RepID=UPI003BA90BDD